MTFEPYSADARQFQYQLLGMQQAINGLFDEGLADLVVNVQPGYGAEIVTGQATWQTESFPEDSSVFEYMEEEVLIDQLNEVRLATGKVGLGHCAQSLAAFLAAVYPEMHHDHKFGFGDGLAPFDYEMATFHSGKFALTNETGELLDIDIKRSVYSGVPEAEVVAGYRYSQSQDFSEEEYNLYLCGDVIVTAFHRSSIDPKALARKYFELTGDFAPTEFIQAYLSTDPERSEPFISAFEFAYQGTGQEDAAMMLAAGMRSSVLSYAQSIQQIQTRQPSMTCDAIEQNTSMIQSIYMQ